MKKLPLVVVLWISCASITENAFAEKPNPHTNEDEEKDHFLHVVNNSEYNAEPVVRWAASYLKIRNVTICISHQTRFFEEDGFVVKLGDIYFIYLKNRLVNVDLILIHEMIHVKQYERGDLVLKNNSTVTYKGTQINLKYTDYESRLFEIEAHASDSKILHEYLRYKKALKNSDGWISAATEGDEIL